jgi:hypothetical protein
MAPTLSYPTGFNTPIFFYFQHENKEWALTVFSLKDAKPTRLPIVDIAVKDIGNKKQKFKIEIGQVCYT